MSVVHGSVVVGVDGSEASAAALDWAVRQAAVEARPLILVHACGVPGAIRDFEDIVANERGLMSVGRTIAREAEAGVRHADPSVGVESVVTMGSADTVLVEASETADVVVVGARGRGAIASALLGSVSATLARESQCPVVVVRGLPAGADAPRTIPRTIPAQPAGTDVTAAHDAQPRPVVVGVDGTPVSSNAVEFAFRMASLRGLPLTILHATRGPREQLASVVDVRTYAEKVNLSEEEELLVAETVHGLCEKYPDVSVTEVYRRGEPVHQLVEASHRAALVVVGTRGRRLLKTTLLGSVSRAVVERAGCPVAVVRP